MTTAMIPSTPTTVAAMAQTGKGVLTARERNYTCIIAVINFTFVLFFSFSHPVYGHHVAICCTIDKKHVLLQCPL